MSLTVDLEGISAVLVGAINPAIFHPEWFRAQGLLLEDDFANAEVEIVSPTITIVTLGRMRLTVQPERFQVETKSLDLLCTVRDLLLGTFRILEHTPLKTMGINRHIHFRMQDEEQWHRVGHYLVPKSPWEGLVDDPGTASVQVQGRRPGSSAESLLINVGPSTQVQPGVYVGTNEHYVSAGAGKPLDLLGYLEREWELAQQFAQDLAWKLLRRCTE